MPFLEDLRHLPKSAKHALAIEFSGLEIGRAAESYRPRMAKDLPKPLRTLYRCGGAWAVNGFTSSNAAVDEIERQSHEASYLGHMLAVDLEQ